MALKQQLSLSWDSS